MSDKGKFGKAVFEVEYIPEAVAAPDSKTEERLVELEKLQIPDWEKAVMRRQLLAVALPDTNFIVEKKDEPK